MRVVYQPLGACVHWNRLSLALGNINIWHAGAVNLGQAQWERKLEGSKSTNVHLHSFHLWEYAAGWSYEVSHFCDFGACMSSVDEAVGDEWDDSPITVGELTEAVP